MRLISMTGMKPNVYRVFKLEEAKKTYAHIEKQAYVGKVVIRFTE